MRELVRVVSIKPAVIYYSMCFHFTTLVILKVFSLNVESLIVRQSATSYTFIEVLDTHGDVPAVIATPETSGLVT